MKLREELDAAKQKSKELDAARMALPDSAPDAYFAAVEAEGKAYNAWNNSMLTAAQQQGQAEQAEASRKQLEATQRLAAKDANRPALGKSQAQLDSEYDAELRKNQE